IAKAASEAEAQAAAAYFSSLKPKPNIKVVETDTVPATQIARVFYMLVKDGGTELIGDHHPLHHLPWPRPEGRGFNPRHRRALAELSGASALRFSAAFAAGKCR